MNSKDNITRLCLWSGPRNISTTLMYSFNQREDTTVFDEPLYAHYLSQTPAKDYHPSADKILKSQENDGKEVIKMMMGDHPTSVVFFKNMTHHLLDLDKSFMKNTVNILLTRNPKEMIPSFDKVIENPTIEDLGYAKHVELVDYFKANDIKFVVLESKAILMNPKGVLSQLCDFADISFSKAMLEWEAGPIPEDGIWASHWYTNVHNSTGYLPYKPKNEPFPKHLEGLLEECTPYYKKLEAHALY